MGGSILLAWGTPSKEKKFLNVSHDGAGVPWVEVRSLAAIPLTKPIQQGFSIKKTIEPIEKANSDHWTVGDSYQVKLEVDSQSDNAWVAISDPIPAGATLLGGLKKSAQEKSSTEGNFPTFEERKAEGYFAYYDFVPKGKWKISYSVRLGTKGEFGVPPTRVEAMYNAETFGEIPNEKIVVH
jgi:uncharacterized protein YfaS (alpha-2-macroglobulin family)